MRPLKPLETKARKEARDRRNKTLLGLFIITIMLFSGVGYALWQREPTEAEQENIRQYNNHTFIKIERGWQTEVMLDNKKIILESIYLPEELENITIILEDIPLSDFKYKTLFLVADDTNELQAGIRLISVLESFVQKWQFACLEQEADDPFCLEKNLPIKSCEDAGISTAIIILKEQNTNVSASYEESCLTIEGRGSDLLKAAEKTIFVMFEVM